MSDQENKLVVSIRKTDYEVPYTVEKCDNDETKYFFVLKGEVFNALENEAYYKSKAKFQVEGFRRGKAPKHIIKTMYGPYAFLEDTLDVAIDECYRAFYTTVMPGLRLGAKLDLGYDECNAEQVAFHFVAIEYPVLQTLNYKGLDVQKVEPQEVSDEMVDKKLQDALSKAGYWQDVTDRAAQNGDTVTIDYAGSIDGEFFAGGSADNQDLVLGSQTFIPGFEEQVVGMNIDEERDIKVTFPAYYGATELAGKESNFHIKLHAIKVKVLPNADDEFAKDVSEFNTLDELKASYRNELKEQEEKRAKDQQEHNLLDAVVVANDVKLNDKIIEEAAAQKVEEFKHMIARSGMKMEDYLNYTGTTEEKMLQDYKESCAVSEKRGCILSQILKDAEIKVSTEELDARIAKDTEKVGKEVDEYKKEMKSEELDYLYNSMLSDKLVDFLSSVNNFVDKVPEQKA